MTTPSANASPAGGMSDAARGGIDTYRRAIDATTATLERRARLFRMLILIVSLGILVSCSWAVLARSWTPLLLLTGVIASIGAFFYLDALRLNRWRVQLLRPWQQRELDFVAFNAAIRAIPGLPAETVAAMLKSLPQAADLAEERQWDVAGRERMAAALAARDRRHATRLLLKTLGVLLAGIATGSLLLRAV